MFLSSSVGRADTLSSIDKIFNNDYLISVQASASIIKAIEM